MEGATPKKKVPRIQTRRKKRGARGGKIAQSGSNAFGSSITEPAGSTMTRVELRANISEPTTLGTIVTYTLDVAASQWPMLVRYARGKVLRVGIAVLPGSYMEFIVRNVTFTGITNRALLLAQPDCECIRVIQGGPLVTWFKPNEPLYKGWQDCTGSTTVFKSGLHLQLTGQNDLQSGASGFVGQVRIELELAGVAPDLGSVILSQYSFNDLVEEMEKRKGLPWSDRVEEDEVAGDFQLLTLAPNQ